MAKVCSIDDVISVVGRPSDQRSTSQIDQILPWFLKKSELFKSLKTEVVRDIVKNCEFLSIPNDDVLIKQGERGDCFYVLLTGTVSIYIETALPEGDIVQTNGESNGVGLWKTSVKKLVRSSFGNYIARLEAGKSFGELALINKDCVRNASIITDEQCELIVVNRALYNRCIKAYQIQEFNRRRDFVEDFPLFSSWPLRYKRQMAMSLRKTTVSYGGVIVKQGDPVDAVYFVLSGEVKISVDPSLYKKSEPHRRSMSAIVNTLPEKELLYQSPKTRRHSALTRKYSRHVEVCTLKPIETIGDIELCMDLPHFTVTATCAQETDLFVLNIKNFERLILKRNPKARTMLCDIVKCKLNFWNSRSFTQDGTPVFENLLAKAREHGRQAQDASKEGGIVPSFKEDGWESIRRFSVISEANKSVMSQISMKSRPGFTRPGFISKRPGTTKSTRVSDPQEINNKMVQDLNQQRCADMVAACNIALKFTKWKGFVNKLQSFETGMSRTDEGSKENGHVTKNDVHTSRNHKTVAQRVKHVRQGITQDEAKIEKEVEANFRFLDAETESLMCSLEEKFPVEDEESVVTRLEQKMESWHARFDTRQHRRVSTAASERVVHLKRFHPQEKKHPKPGKTIILRPKTGNVREEMDSDVLASFRACAEKFNITQ